jgi:hypothetical protein
VTVTRSVNKFLVIDRLTIERGENVTELDLMNYQQVAALLHRSPDSLRTALSRNTDEVWVQRLNAAKLKLGRRVLFKRVMVEAFIDEICGRA